VGEALDGRLAAAWIGCFVSAFAERREELDDLDRRAGDGDFASNLLPAIEPAAAALASAQGEGADAVFTVLSNAFMGAGGTSGPLFGMWFRELAKAAAAGGGSIDLAGLAGGAGAGRDIVMRLGGAAAGDRTMLDAMVPAADALTVAASAGADLRDGLRDAATAAREGAEATAGMVARRGRASYVGDAARGVRDPGAVAVAVFFEAADEALAGDGASR
jgi:dihydroxyacetone kinase-like protein